MRAPIIELKIPRNSSHPWIYSKMVRHPSDEPAPGTIVELQSRDGRRVGWGTYHPKQMVAVRVLSEHPDDVIDLAFFKRRIDGAKRFREETLGLLTVTDSYRLIHGEADGLSGVVIDKLGDTLVIEAYSAGLSQFGELVVKAVRELYPGCRAGIRQVPRIEKQEGFSLKELAQKYPLPPETVVHENGLKFKVNLATGHKTGFFLDQRDNRMKAARLARGMSVLDLCCYTGGFAIAALGRGAVEVTGVDLDEKAIETAKANAALNHLPRDNQRLKFIHRDVFDFLREAVREKRQADMVIVDPAKFVASRDDFNRGLAKYRDLNQMAVKTVRPGGIYITCSCSGLVSEETFRNTVSHAAAEAGRTLQFFESAGAGPDHPVSSSYPEGRYLKVLFARVMD